MDALLRLSWEFSSPLLAQAPVRTPRSNRAATLPHRGPSTAYGHALRGYTSLRMTKRFCHNTLVFSAMFLMPVVKSIAQ